MPLHQCTAVWEPHCSYLLQRYYFLTACARFPLQITCVICESPFLDFSTPVWGCDWALSEFGNCLKQYPFILIFSFIYTTTENPFEKDPKRYSYTQPFILGGCSLSNCLFPWRSLILMAVWQGTLSEVVENTTVCVWLGHQQWILSRTCQTPGSVSMLFFF